MSEFVPAATVDEIPVGSMKAVELMGRKVAIFHTRSGFYASDNSCPHRGGPLVEGDLMGEEVVCPWHLWTFSLCSGKNDRNPEISLTTHEVRVEGKQIFVKVNQQSQ
jgi:nitrite reductase (NADH) small subunit